MTRRIEIEISKTIDETIVLSVENVINVVRSYLFDKLGGNDVEMMDGELCVTQWEATHGSGITRKIRVATKLDISRYDVIKSLRNQ